MATETATEGSATEATATGVEKPLQHKLERKWTFWFDNQSKPKQGAAWGSSLRKVYTFDTVEEFWWYLLYLSLSLSTNIPVDLFFCLFLAFCWMLS